MTDDNIEEKLKRMKQIGDRMREMNELLNSEEITNLYDLEKKIVVIDNSDELNEDQKREEKRKKALDTLSDLKDIAIVALIEGGYGGKAYKDAMHTFKFQQTMEKSKEFRKILVKSLLESRDENTRYSGSVSLLEVINKVKEKYIALLDYLKVGDIMELAGYKIESNEQTNQYVADLNKKKKSDLINTYLSNQIIESLKEENK